MTLMIHQNSHAESLLPSNPRPSCATLRHEGVVHPVPRPSPGPQIPGVSAEEPDEAGGVTMVESGVPAQLEDFVSMESVFAADITDAQATGRPARGPVRKGWLQSRRPAPRRWSMHPPDQMPFAPSRSSRCKPVALTAMPQI